MPIYDPIKSRKDFIEEVLNHHPARHDLPIIIKDLMGNPRSLEMKAKALIGIRTTANDWHFWWLSLSGEVEPDLTYGCKNPKESAYVKCPYCHKEFNI